MSDRLDVGKMDRYLIAQVDTVTKSPGGQIKHTWTDSFPFWAEQSDDIVSENITEIATVATVTTIFITHYRPDLVRTMRIKQDSDFWLITNIQKDRITMKISCERLDE